jgi:hypothetical protein
MLTRGGQVKKESKPAEKPMDAHAWRRAILAGLEKATKPVLPLSSRKLISRSSFMVRAAETALFP